MLRFDQAVLAIAMLASFAFRAPWLVPIWTAVLLVNIVTGRRGGPFLLLYDQWIATHLAAPPSLTDPRPARFSWIVNTVLLAGGTCALVLGVSGVTTAVALIVGVIAAFETATGTCVVCEIVRRMRGR
jgi:energy-converting hydrogenase Eha subunit A